MVDYGEGICDEDMAWGLRPPISLGMNNVRRANGKVTARRTFKKRILVSDYKTPFQCKLAVI